MEPTPAMDSRAPMEGMFQLGASQHPTGRQRRLSTYETNRIKARKIAQAYTRTPRAKQARLIRAIEQRKSIGEKEPPGLDNRAATKTNEI